MAFLPADYFFQSQDFPGCLSLSNFSLCPIHFVALSINGASTVFNDVGLSPVLFKRSMSFSGTEICEEHNGENEFSDDGSQMGEKKRRLNLEQVKALEKSFELGNKLEPERKMQLAKALGLQPRQIAIWFQNRRARWKTKQLEKDYDLLKKKLEAVKADNDALQAQNKKLHAELWALKGGESTGAAVDLRKETEASWSYGTENSADINLDISRTPATSNCVSSQFSEKHLFPSSLRPACATQVTHLLRGTPGPGIIPTLKINQMAQDDGFCNMLSGIEDQPALWPWPEQQPYSN